MKNKPKVSIITVCYNCKDDLEKTVSSVLTQTCKNYEFIVIDGESTDGTQDIIEKNKARIDYWISEKDYGIYNAMNKGCKLAHGDYVYFLNAGDIFHKTTTLEGVERFLLDVDMLYGNIRFVSKDGQVDYVKKKYLSKRNVKLGQKIGQQAVFVRKEIFDQIGGLDERYKIAADFDLLCKIFERDSRVKYVDEIICDYDSSGVSSNLKKSYGDTAEVIRNRYGLTFFIFYFIITRIKLLVAGIIKSL